MTLAVRHQVFHDRHQTGCCVIRDARDGRSCRRLAALCATAIATRAAASRVNVFRRDCGGVSRDDASTHAIAASNSDIDDLLTRGSNAS